MHDEGIQWSNSEHETGTVHSGSFPYYYFMVFVLFCCHWACISSSTKQMVFFFRKNTMMEKGRKRRRTRKRKRCASCLQACPLCISAVCLWFLHVKMCKMLLYIGSLKRADQVKLMSQWCLFSTNIVKLSLRVTMWYLFQIHVYSICRLNC